METRSKEIKSRQHPLVSMLVTPGHFATRHSHINFCVDLTAIKSQIKIARQAGEELAAKYAGSAQIDTIICLDGTEVLAAFLGSSLELSGRGVNTGSNIAVLTPEINTSGQLMFRDNAQRMIWNRNVLLLVASATTGTTVTQAIECIDYYRGRIIGVCAIFSAADNIGGFAVQSLFTIADVPGYATYAPGDCPECKAHHKIDALVNSYGYSKI